MNRRKFFTKLGLSTAVGVIAPSVLLANTKKIKAIKTAVPAKLCIDAPTIAHIRSGGERLTVAEILQLYHETGILIYESQYGYPPIVIEGEVECVDVTGL